MKVSKPIIQRVIGYTRVSTSEQAKEGISLDNQYHKIEAYAGLKDMNLLKIITEEGKSGKNLNRPGIEEVIRMAKNKEIDAIIVYKLDRLTRKTRDLLYLIEDVFARNNTQFISLNENIDTSSASGKFFLTVMGAMAQMERDLIAERTTDALQELTRQGRRLGNPDKVPFGLRLLKRRKAEIADLQPDPEEIKTVREIFRLRRKKITLEKIGNRFSMAKSTVKYILDNPVYNDFLPSTCSVNER